MKRAITGILLLIPFLGVLFLVGYSTFHDPVLLSILVKILYVCAAIVFVIGLAIATLFVYYCTKNGLSLLMGNRAPKGRDE
jgi:hypothetical protein